MTTGVIMGLQDEILSTIGESPGENSLELNVVVREVTDDGEPYFVAECVEIPGCVSEGSSAEEARANVEKAIRLCLSVIIEDAFRQVMSRKSLPNLVRTVKQDRLRVNTPSLDIQYA